MQDLTPSPESLRSVSGIVFNIMRYCVHDGPGIRTTVFLKGCPLRCSWCHNPEGQAPEIELTFRDDRCIRCGDCFAACPNGAVGFENEKYFVFREQCQRCGSCVDACAAGAREMVGSMMTAEEVLREILKDRSFFDESGGGVTFSGGEPLMNPEFLLALLEHCRQHGVHTAIETTGYAPWEVLEQVAEKTDLFLYDLKLMEPEAHFSFTGVSNELILQNLMLLSCGGNEVIVRVPVIPAVNDHDVNIMAMADFLRERTNLRTIHLLPYHRIGREKSVRIGREEMPEAFPALEEARLMHIANLLRESGFEIAIGG